MDIEKRFCHISHIIVRGEVAVVVSDGGQLAVYLSTSQEAGGGHGASASLHMMARFVLVHTI